MRKLFFVLFFSLMLSGVAYGEQTEDPGNSGCSNGKKMLLEIASISDPIKSQETTVIIDLCQVVSMQQYYKINYGGGVQTGHEYSYLKLGGLGADIYTTQYNYLEIVEFLK